MVYPFNGNGRYQITVMERCNMTMKRFIFGRIAVLLMMPVVTNADRSTGTHTFQEAEIRPSDTGEIFDRFSSTRGGASV
jgi:hypothetical protein